MMASFFQLLRWFLRDLLTYWRTLVIILAPIILLAIPATIKTLVRGSETCGLALDYKRRSSFPFMVLTSVTQVLMHFVCDFWSHLLTKFLEANCAYVVLLMAVYWVTEVAPLPATAMLPIVLFPLLGIATTRVTCAEYLKDTNFIFVGGLIMAVALEDSNLHKRIALRVLLWMGDEPRWLMLGFMGTTAFLSMWMSNTATAAMMLPIAMVVLEELVRYELVQEKSEMPLLSGSPSATRKASRASLSKRGSIGRKAMIESKALASLDNEEFEHLTVSGQEAQKLASTAFLTERKWLKVDAVCQTEDVGLGLPNAASSQETATGASHKIPEFHHLPSHLQGMCKATLLCIAYGANLGGTGTLTGTGPNLIFVGQLNKFYPSQTAITYVSWFLFGTPSMILCCFLGWAWLVIVFTGWRSLFFGCCQKKKQLHSDVQKALRQKYDELGKISFAEWSITFWLVVLVLLWVLREPLFISGWDDWLKLKTGYSSDACAGILIAFILFVFPNEKPDFLCFRRDKRKAPRLRQSLMSWTSMQKKFPWGVIVLLGGGFALAEGVKIIHDNKAN